MPPFSTHVAVLSAVPTLIVSRGVPVTTIALSNVTVTSRTSPVVYACGYAWLVIASAPVTLGPSADGVTGPAVPAAPSFAAVSTARTWKV